VKALIRWGGRANTRRISLRLQLLLLTSAIRLRTSSSESRSSALARTLVNWKLRYSEDPKIQRRVFGRSRFANTSKETLRWARAEPKWPFRLFRVFFYTREWRPSGRWLADAAAAARCVPASRVLLLSFSADDCVIFSVGFRWGVILFRRSFFATVRARILPWLSLCVCSSRTYSSLCPPSRCRFCSCGFICAEQTHIASLLVQ